MFNALPLATPIQTCLGWEQDQQSLDPLDTGRFWRKPRCQFPQSLEIGTVSIFSTSMPLICCRFAIVHLFLQIPVAVLRLASAAAGYVLDLLYLVSLTSIWLPIGAQRLSMCSCERTRFAPILLVRLGAVSGDLLSGPSTPILEPVIEIDLFVHHESTASRADKARTAAGISKFLEGLGS